MKLSSKKALKTILFPFLFEIQINGHIAPCIHMKGGVLATTLINPPLRKSRSAQNSTLQ